MLVEQKTDERRRAERVSVSLPVVMENAEYITRDISASSVYFETSETFALGERISFVVELSKQAGQMLLKCNGEIVRVVKENGKIGVAVEILNAVMESEHH